MPAIKSSKPAILIHQFIRRLAIAAHQLADDLRAAFNPAPTAEMPDDWNLPGTNDVRLQQYHQRIVCRSWGRS